LTSYLSLLFLTPTCLKEQGGCLKEPHFYHIIKELFRRASLIYYFHHNFKEVDLHYQSLIDRAGKVQKVRDYSRFVSWEKVKELDDRGLLGEVRYAGKFRHFLPLIKLGEFMHIGENTVFGLGRFKVKFS